MFIRIIQFKDGKYGIKSGIFIHKFLDVGVVNAKSKNEPGIIYWWFLESFIEQKCKFDTLEECEKAIQHYKRLGIKSDETDISHKTVKWLW